MSSIPVLTPPATQVCYCLSSGCPYVDRVIRSSMFVFTPSVVEPWFMCIQSAHALMRAVALIMRAVVLRACSALSVVEFCLACSDVAHARSRH